MKYSWQISIDMHLNDFLFMSNQEFEMFLDYKRFGIPMRQFFVIFMREGKKTASEKVALIICSQVIGNNFGQPLSIEKLTGDERDNLSYQVNKIIQECKQVNFRRTVWESC